MLRPLTAVIALTSMLLIVGGSGSAHAQFPSITVYSACFPDSTYIIWNVFDPAPGQPEWVGFDVMRRTLPGCDEFVRVNEEIIPRLPEPGYLRTFGEPSNGLTAEYRVVPVDVNRQPVAMSPSFCSPCNEFVNCPSFTSPITVGTLQELAPGFVYVIACPGTCYPSPFFAGGVPGDLAPYVGSGTALRLFGTISCGGVEGCSFNVVDHWEIGSCVTPTATQSWGRLKTIYR